MGNTTISKNLHKTSSVLLKDGTVLEGINYGQFRRGEQPTSIEHEEETKEEKKARLLKELSELE